MANTKSMMSRAFDWIENMNSWFKKATPRQRMLLYFIVILVGGGFIILMVSTGMGTGEHKGLPSLLNTGAGNGLGSLLAKKPNLPSLLTHVTKTDQTVEGIMCKMMIEHSMQNITLGSTICYPWNTTLTNSDCVCLTPIS